MIAISGVAFDITRTMSTFRSGAKALETIWDILEPTIAGIVSTLPTYKTLLGRSKRKTPALENLGPSKATFWKNRCNHDTETGTSGELGSNLKTGLKAVSTNKSAESSRICLQSIDVV